MSGRGQCGEGSKGWQAGVGSSLGVMRSQGLKAEGKAAPGGMGDSIPREWCSGLIGRHHGVVGADITVVGADALGASLVRRWAGR
jgi:hypothetical protein